MKYLGNKYSSEQNWVAVTSTINHHQYGIMHMVIIFKFWGQTNVSYIVENR